MAEPVIAIERHRHPRAAGVLKLLGDITYAVLRRYEIGEVKTYPASSSMSRKSARLPMDGLGWERGGRPWSTCACVPSYNI